MFRGCTPSVASGSERHIPKLLEALCTGRWQQLPDLITNNLQSAAEDLSRPLGELTQSFAQLPLLAYQLTGSGSACFGLCRSHREAARAAAWLRGRRAAWATATSTA